MSLLLVSAVRFEAEPALEFLKDQGIACDFFPVGIGPLNAAKSETNLKEKCNGKHVIYVGSCGSFYPFVEPHLVTVSKVYWLPPCLRTGIAGCPENLHPPIALPSCALDLPQKSVLTTPSISLVADFDPEQEKKLPDRTELVENMELYACAQGLLSASSLSVVLGVTNEVGPNGRSDWARNFRAVARLTADFLRSSGKLKSS